MNIKDNYKPLCCSYQSFQPVKPKSWDNLTTKAFGGYGFGYGYMEAGSSTKNQTHSASCTSSSNTMPAKMKPSSKSNGMKVNLNQVYNISAFSFWNNLQQC